MLFGAMNNPTRDVTAEIENIAALGLDFVDLTLEPPCAASEDIDAARVKALLAKLGLKVIAHSAYYLPLSNPFPSLRRCAIAEYEKVLAVAHAVGAPYCTMHYDSPHGMADREDVTRWYIGALQVLAPIATDTTIVIENIPARKQLSGLGKVLEAMPEVGLHLDVAHAFIEGGMPCIEQYLRRYGDRLAHLHVSENDGSGDQHLPLGHYEHRPLDWQQVFDWLRECGYTGTVTFEIFHGGKERLQQSVELVKSLL